MASLDTLPPELLLEIARYGNASEWRALCATHPSMRSVAEELLYKSIVFRVHNTRRDCAPQLQSLYDTLLRRPPLASQVKALLLQLPRSEHPLRMTVTDIADKKRQLERLLQVLLLTTNLAHLTILGISLSELWPSLRGLEPQTLPRLDHLVIDGVEISPIWFAFPHLASVHIGPLLRVHSKRIAVAPNPAVKTVEWTRGHFGYVQNEEALRLYGGSPEPGAATLLDGFPQLASLRFQLRMHHERKGRVVHSMGYHPDETGVPPTIGSFDVLLGKTNISDHTAARVERLVVELENLDQEEDLEWIRPVNSLPTPYNGTLLRFSSLRYLEIPQQALIATNCPPTLPSAQLPLSLETIVIRHADVDIEGWLADIPKNHDTLPALQDVTVHFRHTAPDHFPLITGGLFKDLG